MLKPLTNEQQIKVEENMGLVGKVIQDCVHTLGTGCIYDYDDLFQIGCIGLCKAAQTDQPGYNVAFSTYAYRLIRNEIYTQLEYATRRGREVATDPDEMPCSVLDDETTEQREASLSLLHFLDRAEADATGVAAKGCRPSGCSLKDTATVRLENCLAYRPTMLQRGLLRRGRS